MGGVLVWSPLVSLDEGSSLPLRVRPKVYLACFIPLYGLLDNFRGILVLSWSGCVAPSYGFSRLEIHRARPFIWAYPWRKLCLAGQVLFNLLRFSDLIFTFDYKLVYIFVES